MTILNYITRAKHKEVEALPLIQELMHGKVTEEKYAAYLFELYAIYSTLESLADKLGLLDGLVDIHRSEKIKLDLNELAPSYNRDLTNSTMEYLKYIQELSENNDKKHLLFAHIYVRHMGDLYGGKLMARVVPGSGKSYEFSDRPTLIKQFNERLYLELGDEANLAFDHFINIFNELYKIW